MLIERLLVRWLRAVAPADWTESVLGDLDEDASRPRFRRLVHLARIAARFTVDAAIVRWQNRPRGGMSRIWHDVRYSARALRQSPGFSAAAIVTLALAVGANTAIYSTLSALVLNPLPFADGHRYVFIWHKNADMGGVLVTPSVTAIDRWRRATHVFDAVESYGGRSVIVTDGGEPEELTLTFLRASTLATFGVRPLIGRPIVPADLEPDAPPVVLISYAFWQARFAGDPDVAGRPLRLGDHAYTVIGVMPRRFALPMGSDALWAAARPGLGATADSENAIARLVPGVSADEAQAALDAMGGGDGADRHWRGQILTAADSNGTSIRTALYVLSGAVGCLLAIACVNVASLVLSRHTSRARETAIRHALGASRRRLVRAHLIESALVAGAGGLAGVGVAALGLSTIAALRPSNLDVITRAGIDAGVWRFALAASAATAILFGLAPAISASRVRLRDVLTSGGRSITPASHRARRVLTVVQVALAVVLLVGAGLLGRSYLRLTAVAPGYDPAGILSIRVSLPSSRYPAASPDLRTAFFDAATDSIAALPGVDAVAVGNGVPPESGVSFGRLEIEGAIEGAAVRTVITSGGYVTPSYFSTLRIPIVDGRVFTDDDDIGRDRVVVVGKSLADRYWPGQSPLGARLRLQAKDPWSTVVGVVADVKALSLSTTSGPGQLQLYQPRAQLRPAFGAIIVRTSGDPLAIVPAIKQRLWAIDPALVLRDVATSAELLSRSTSQSRFNVALLVAFAVSGLALAIVGVYGVTALFVGERQREVGIRMALGATRAAVLSFVVRQSLAVVGLGVAIGATGAAWLSRYLQDLVFGVSTHDAVSFLAAPIATAAAAALAILAPLRRAASVDPATVLRGE
jgi:putative ABC transport system permease protein